MREMVVPITNKIPSKVTGLTRVRLTGPPLSQAKHALRPIVVDLPALSTLQLLDPRRAPARAHRGDFLDTHPQNLLTWLHRREANRRVRRAQHADARRSATR